MDSSDEEVQVEVAPVRIRQCEFNQKQMREIIKQLESLFKKYSLDKDVCVELIKFLRTQPGFKKGDGEWQCIIGSNFGCSLSYDLGLLTFFDFIENGKSILIFKSG